MIEVRMSAEFGGINLKNGTNCHSEQAIRAKFIGNIDKSFLLKI